MQSIFEPLRELETAPHLESLVNEHPDASLLQLHDVAIAKISQQEFEWDAVAGQLKLLERQQRLPYDDFRGFIRTKVEDGVYTPLLNDFTDAELSTASTWINPSRDFLYTTSGATMMSRRYLDKDERVQWVYMTIALLLARREANRLVWARLFYDELSLLRISLATPFLLNLRKVNGNLSSCFIAACYDDLESITQLWHEVAFISKNSGGVGIYLSRLRAKGSWVKGVKNASGGVCGWVRIFNAIAVTVNQGGKRAGAVTTALDIWHLDVPEFLDLQTENGDQRKKAYDVMPQIVFNDVFMERAEAKQDWLLFDPYEVQTVLGLDLTELQPDEFRVAYLKVEAAAKEGLLKLTKTINARKLYLDILRVTVETGMPYQTFRDEINWANPNRHRGVIPSANLCVESFSNVLPHEEVHVCNLVSLNLARITHETLASSTRYAVRMLDNAIDLTEPPVLGAKTHNQLYRTIGLGIMGLADWFAKNEIRYSKGHAEASRLQEDIAYNAFKENIALARERGSYKAYPGSPLSKGVIFGRLFSKHKSVSLCELRKHVSAEQVEAAINNPVIRHHLIQQAETLGINVIESQHDWQEIVDGLINTGARCSQLMAIAPNTSSSLLQGCSASFLPVFARYFKDGSGKGALPVTASFLKTHYWFYEENRSLDQNVVVEVTAALQQWVDTGISMELLFDLNNPEFRNATYLMKLIFKAWRSKIKAVYYLRWLERDDTREQGRCSTCAN